MRNRARLLIAIPVLIAVALGGVLLATSRLAHPTPAFALVDETTLVVLKGTVEVQRPGGSFTPVSGSSTLRPGDRARTGPASYATITYFEGSTTELEPNTEIEIRRLDHLPGEGKSISFFQEVGTTWNRVERLVDAQSRFETVTASGVAYVRGTEYRVVVDEQHQVTVEAVTDSVSVEAVVDGVTTAVVVAPGFQTTVVPGQAPSDPVPAPAARFSLQIDVDGPTTMFLTDDRSRSVGFHPQASAYTSQIPGAQYSGRDGRQRITIPDPVDSYDLVLKGEGDGGIYGLTLSTLVDGQPVATRAVGLARVLAAEQINGSIAGGQLIGTGFSFKGGSIQDVKRPPSTIQQPPASSHVAFAAAPLAAQQLTMAGDALEAAQVMVALCHPTGQTTEPYARIVVPRDTVASHLAQGDLEPTDSGCPVNGAAVTGAASSTRAPTIVEAPIVALAAATATPVRTSTPAATRALTATRVPTSTAAGGNQGATFGGQPGPTSTATATSTFLPAAPPLIAEPPVLPTPRPAATATPRPPDTPTAAPTAVVAPVVIVPAEPFLTPTPFPVIHPIGFTPTTFPTPPASPTRTGTPGTPSPSPTLGSVTPTATIATPTGTLPTSTPTSTAAPQSAATLPPTSPPTRPPTLLPIHIPVHGAPAPTETATPGPSPTPTITLTPSNTPTRLPFPTAPSTPPTSTVTQTPGTPTATSTRGTPTATPTSGTPTATPTSGTPPITRTSGTPSVTPIQGTPTVTLTPGTPTVTGSPGTPTVTPTAGTPTATPTPGTPIATPTAGTPTVTQTPDTPTVTPTVGSPTPTATPPLGPNTVSWINPAGGLWTDPTNWSPSRVPLQTDNASITLPGSYTVVLSGGASVGSLALGGAGSAPTLRIQGDSTNGDGRLDLATGLTNNGSIQMTSIDAPHDVRITVANGSLVNAASHTISIDAGTGGGGFLGTLIDNQGAITIARPTNISAGAGGHHNAGTITVSGADLEVDMFVSGTTFTNSGSIQLDNNRTLTVNGGTLALQTGSAISAGQVDLSQVTVSGSGTLANAAGSRLTVLGVTINAPISNNGTMIVRGFSVVNGQLTTGVGSLLRILGDGCCAASLNMATGFTNNGAVEMTSINAAQGVELHVASGSVVNPSGHSFAVQAGAGGTATIGALIDNQGTMTIARPTTFTPPSGASSNSGAITVTGNNLEIDMSSPASSFANGGSITLDSGRVLTVHGGSLVPQAGAFNVSEIDLSNLSVDGAGAFNIASGTTVNALEVTMNAPTSISGALVFQGFDIVNGQISTAPSSIFRLLGAACCGSANVQMANGFTNNGTIEMTSQDSGQDVSLQVTSGPIVNAVGATISIPQGTGGNGLLGSLIDNRGTIAIGRNVRISGGGGAHRNTGTIDVVGADLEIDMFVTGTTFTNSGAITLGGGHILTIVGGSFSEQNSGSVSSTEIDLNNTTFAGPGSLVIPGGGTLNTISTTIMAPVTNNGTLLARASNTISGALTTTSGSILRVQGESTFDSDLVVASGFTNNGSIELTSIDAPHDATLIVSSGSLVNPAGHTISILSGSGGNGFLKAGLTNVGSITSGRNLTIDAGAATHTNSGTINVSGGDLTLLQFGVGATFTNSGSIQLATGHILTMNSGTFVQQVGGTVDAPEVDMTTLTVNGPGAWTNGAGDTLNLLGITMNAPLTNNETMIVRGFNIFGGGITTGSNSLIVIQGESCCDATLDATTSFTNNGTIQLTSVQGAHNATLQVDSGTLTNASGRLIQPLVGTGGNRTINATLDNAGTVSSPAPLQVNGDVSNSGRIDPGGSSANGCIDIAGNFTQVGGGDIWVKIGGTSGACTGNDVVRVTGNASLSGLLDVTLLNGFDPSAGQTFTVLSYGSETGDFTSYDLPSGQFQPAAPGGTSLVLTAQ